MSPRRAHCPAYHSLRLRALSFGLLAALVFTASGGWQLPAAAQDEKPAPFRLALSFKDDDKIPASELRLRPNVPQEVFVYVVNTSGDDKDLAVELMAGDTKAASGTVKASKDRPSRVKWTTPPGKAAGMQELPGAMTFRMVDKGAEIGKRVGVKVAAPRSYMKVEKAKFFPENEKDPDALNRLEIEVKRDPGFVFAGPPCRVELALLPERIPGFVPGQRREGVYTGFLPEKDRVLTLEAKNLVFQKKTRGFVILNADGYQRAFIYHTSFPDRGTPSDPVEVTAPMLRTNLPAYGLPKADFPLIIEADNVSDDERIKLDVLASKDVFTEVAEFKGPRQKKDHFALGGPRGGILLKTDVKDWATTIDLSGVSGQTKVRLRRVGADGKAIVDKDGNPVKVKSGVTYEDVENVEQTIIIDNTAPNLVEFVEPLPIAVRGKRVTLRARCQDKESGIRDVVFHLGKPAAPADKAAPAPVLIQGSRFKETDVWVGEVAIAPDQKGPVEITVRATNGVGLSSTATTALPQKAGVSGRVYDKDVPIDNLRVRLLNAKGKVLTSTRTASGGKFAFINLDKGKYKLDAFREATNSSGEITFDVEESTAQIKDLELVLRPAPAGQGDPGKKGRIDGTVLEGDRPQPELTVQLSDATGKVVLQTTKTDANGKYFFRFLGAGTYWVVSTRTASRTRGVLRVDLKDGEQKTGADVKLLRR